MYIIYSPIKFLSRCTYSSSHLVHPMFFSLLILDFDSDVARPDKISGADINSICQEVWLFMFA